MIHGTHGQSGGKSSKKAKAKMSGGWMAHSAPDAKEDLGLDLNYEEMEMPGPSSVAQGKARQAAFWKPKKHELIDPKISLMQMAEEGYWSCSSPCYHLQTLQEGCECNKCGNIKMNFNKPVGEC
jgi:hypothetical protein